MLIQYRSDKSFRGPTRELIATAKQIIALYESQGYVLTLRQLYYQLVSKNTIKNKENEYKRLSKVMTDARYQGEISWKALEDRTRMVRSMDHWRSPAEIIESSSQAFRHDLWKNQENRVEVWVEKDALIGVLEPVCQRNDVAYFSCRGNASASEMWEGAQRLVEYEVKGQQPWVLYLGDHDPSGVDMTRDVQDRLREFESTAIVKRLALNLDQIAQWNPPPQPAKMTDSRYKRYVKETGKRQSWELDALEPATLDALVQEAIDNLRDPGTWNEDLETQEEQRALLTNASTQWPLLADLLAESPQNDGKTQADN
jgi:hypothetical protein